MKTIYLAKYFNNPKSLNQIIESNFNNFSDWKSYNIFSDKRPDDSEYVLDLNIAESLAENTDNSFVLIQYNLSEDDFFNLFMSRQIEIEPINIRYFWRNPDTKKFVEISKNLSVFS